MKEISRVDYELRLDYLSTDHNRTHASDVLHAVYYLTSQPIPGFTVRPFDTNPASSKSVGEYVPLFLFTDRYEALSSESYKEHLRAEYHHHAPPREDRHSWTGQVESVIHTLKLCSFLRTQPPLHCASFPSLFLLWRKVREWKHACTKVIWTNSTFSAVQTYLASSGIYTTFKSLKTAIYANVCDNADGKVGLSLTLIPMWATETVTSPGCQPCAALFFF